MNSLLRRGITFIPVLLCSLVTPFSTADDFESLADRMAIAEALAAYAYRWDSKDSQAFAELFTEDAVMQRADLGEAKLSFDISGRPAILEYAMNSHTNRLADRQTRHHMSGLVFLELAETTALTESMALITHQTAASGAAFISSSGIYTLHWRKTAEGWRIASRLLISDRFVAPQ